MLAVLDLRILLPEGVTLVIVLKLQAVLPDRVNWIEIFVRWLTLLISGFEPSGSATRRR